MLTSFIPGYPLLSYVYKSVLLTLAILLSLPKGFLLVFFPFIQRGNCNPLSLAMHDKYKFIATEE